MAAPKKADKQVKIVVRAARPRDVVRLYDLLVRYFEELSFAYPTPVEGPTLAWGMTVIVKGGVIVAEAEDQLIGSVGIENDGFPWNPQVRYLNGLWFYVTPERRKGGTAERLLSAAKDIAVKNNLALRLDNVFGIEPELQDEWRKKRGFTYVGGNHVWFPTAPAKDE